MYRQTDRQTETNLRLDVAVCLMEINVTFPRLNVPTFVEILVQTDRQTNRQTDTNLRRDVVISLTEIHVTFPRLNVPTFVEIRVQTDRQTDRDKPEAGRSY